MVDINNTYDNDDEVEPAPGVSEVLLEAVRHHLDDHLKDEDDGESTVGVVQTDLEPLSLTDVNVLHRLPHIKPRSHHST